MARPQETFNKREQEKLRAQKRKEKVEKKKLEKPIQNFLERIYMYMWTKTDT
jgi:hypothetical protein